MGLALPKYELPFTVDQYLEIDRASQDRYLFLDGDIFMMAGESGAHGDITMNLAVLIGSQLMGSPCRARTKDTKVRSGPTPMPGQGTEGLFSYPDLVVICGEPIYHDAHEDVVLNPAVIFEVLSPATEAFDRGDKFDRYRKWNQTLTDYVLVSQSKPQIEHYFRNVDGSWSSSIHERIDTTFTVASIQCQLKLGDVYQRVSFPAE